MREVTSVWYFETSFIRMELRIAGILLMVAGWILMLASVIMLAALPARTSFAVAGLAVEILGFVLLARTHVPKRKKHDA
jgi:membrane-bound ClpP family serine protease